MRILIKRTYMREDSTVGFMQVILSREYESEYLDASVLKPHPTGGVWMTLCDTLEPHAIPWEDKPLIGQHRGERIPGKTAIPEGTYRIELRDSKTYKRRMPQILDVPEFKSIVLRTGKSAEQSRGDILVGKASLHPSPEGWEMWILKDSRPYFNLVYNLIEEAIDYGEAVTLEVSSHKKWTFPNVHLNKE